MPETRSNFVPVNQKKQSYSPHIRQSATENPSVAGGVGASLVSLRFSNLFGVIIYVCS